MKKPTTVFVVVFIVLAILHQDEWNWDKADLVPSLKDGPLDLLGGLSINRWRGRETVQFRVTDARQTSPS